MLDLLGALLVESGLNRGAMDRAVRLREIGKTTDAHPALLTTKATHPNPEHFQQVAHPTSVIAQRLKTVGTVTIGAVFRLYDLLLKNLSHIFLRGKRDGIDCLHTLEYRKRFTPPILFSPRRQPPIRRPPPWSTKTSHAS